MPASIFSHTKGGHSRHHGECSFCLRRAFLRPVRFFPGMWVICTARLCLSCRVNWRDEPYGTLVTTFAHSPRASDRADLATAPTERAF